MRPLEAAGATLAPPLARPALDAAAEPASRTPWIVPRWSDPRIPFAALLTLYAVLGFTVLGFNRSPLQMLETVVAGCALDVALARWFTRRWVVPLSAYITSCSLALLLNYSHGSALLLVPVVFAIASKYLLTFEGRHVFNPSLFGVALSLLTTRELITAAPAYQWAGGSVAMSAFLVMTALALFVFRIGRGRLIGSFLVFYALQTGLRAWIMRYHLPPTMLFVGTLSSPPFFLFTFYMLTDPATSPRTPRGQVLYAAAVALVDLVLHTRESVFTFFYAALICATAKFVFLHARQAWRLGPRHAFMRAVTPAWLGRVTGVAGLCVLFAGAAVSAGVPPAHGAHVAFRMERLGPEHTGIRTAMSDVLGRVDPRLAHIAKWVLSVGDAAAVGDFDGDGTLDLFLTSPLKRPEDRGALYRGLGDLRFERVRLPALERVLAQFPESGLPAAATFVDYDNDGDEDLVLGFGYGTSRLLRNLLAETGRPAFVDATTAAGLDEYTVCLGIVCFDADRDGRLDLLVTNAMAPYLPGYSRPTRLSVFRLPAPEFRGDRRMLRFMHNGWHDATNGGLNAFYRGLAGGRFQKLDIGALGMPETHWTVAAGCGDLNRDGWTDLYLASDFGPDDLYLNERGRGFRRVAGRWYGDVGKDTYKGMNSTFADVDGNGWLDVYVSNNHHALQAEGSLLWMTRPGRDAFVPAFHDEATRRGALNENRWGWGAAAGDLDLDGWIDLVQANGMVDDRLDHRYAGHKDYWYVNHKLMQAGPEIHTYADMWGDLRGRTIFPNEARRAYLNLGPRDPGVFVDVARTIGIADPECSRGVVMADFDNDGDLDLVITNQFGPVSIYRNTLRQPGTADAAHHFLGLRLIGNGTTTNRDAIGTRVEAVVQGGRRERRQVREVTAVGGFSSQCDPRLLFGLGSYAGPVRVTIDWYGGERQNLVLEPDRYHVIRQPAAPVIARRADEDAIAAPVVAGGADEGAIAASATRAGAGGQLTRGREDRAP